MSARFRRSLKCVVVAAVALSACSSGDGGSTTSPTSSSNTPTTLAPAPTTTRTSTTSTSTSTSTTPSLPASTAAPTTDAAAADKAAVVAAVPQTRVAYNYAVTNYDAPDALDVLARSVVRDGPSWQLTVNNMDSLRTNGWVVRPNPDVADTSTVEGEVTLLDGPPATRAQATVCTISAGVVYKPGGAPDGSDLVVNDDVVAYRDRVTMVLDGGTWKIEQGTGLGKWSGATACPAA